MRFKLWLTVVIAGWGVAACAPRQLERPNGVAVAADGSVYIMDFGHYRVVHLSPEGRWLGAFGKLGEAAENIYFGWDLAVGPDGNLYLANMNSDDERTSHDGVKVFTPQGRLVREIGAADYSDYEDIAHKPYGLDIDDMGRVYVADDGTATVRVFAPSGEQLATFFGAGSTDFQFPGINDVAVDDRRQLLYVVDYVQSHVEQFAIQESGGKLAVQHLRTIGRYGSAAGELAFPQNITVDDVTGRVYVGDLANRRIQVFDAAGGYVNEFSPPVVSDWQAMGMNRDAEGNIYVADSLNAVIWVFTAEGDFLRSLGR